MGALEGLLRLTSFLLRAERDGMHRRRDQISFFPVQMDQRTCFGFCIRFAFFHLWFPEKSYKNVAWHATFVFNAGFCHEHDYGQMCENLSCIEFLLYMYSGKIIGAHQSQGARMFFLSKITGIILYVSLYSYYCRTCCAIFIKYICKFCYTVLYEVKSLYHYVT